MTIQSRTSDAICKLIRSSILIMPWQVRGSIKLIPLIAAFQRWVLGYVEGKEFIHTVDAGPAHGLRYPVLLPQDKGVWTGTYEMEFSTLLAKSVRKGDVCLDIGSWRGFFCGVMALAGASRVVAFEPLPDNCDQIRRVMALNSKLPIDLVEAAVSDHEGAMDFYIMPQTSMGKLDNSIFQGDEKSQHKLSVQVITLDKWFSVSGLKAPSVIKIDIEGAELSALIGARRLLAAHHPYLFIEIHSRVLATNCYKLLLELEYRVLVLETSLPPDGTTEPEVCHFYCSHLK